MKNCGHRLWVLFLIVHILTAHSLCAGGLAVGTSAGYNSWQATVSSEGGGQKGEANSTKDSFLGTLSLGYDWGLPFMFLRANFLLRQKTPPQSAQTQNAGTTIHHTLSQDTGFGGEALVGLDVPLLPSPYLKVALTGANASHETNDGAANNIYKKTLWSPSLGGGFKMSFLGFVGALEYLYTSMPSMSHNATLSGTTYHMEAKSMQMHTFAFTLSYIF